MSFLTKTVPFVAMFAVAGCTSEPDCGSNETKTLIKQIAKDNGALLFQAQVIAASQKNAQFTPSNLESEQRKLADFQYNDPASVPQQRAFVQNIIDEANKALMADWEHNASKAEYTVENAIMTEKNQQTGAVACKASLKVVVPEWAWAATDIKYTVEKTTDGKLFATLYGD